LARFSCCTLSAPARHGNNRAVCGVIDFRSTVSRSSGLIDDDGFFWRDVASLRRHLAPEAAEAELRAQIEPARSAGIDPPHIDAHTAAAMLPELLDCHVRLGHDYGRASRTRSGLGRTRPLLIFEYLLIEERFPNPALF
jgi:predicted glycoside hydrolase/deacetylase ChbG (UPF0249 family)